MSLAIFHPHFVIRIFPSSFYHPHFSIRILSSAIRHPPSAIRHPPSAIRRHPVLTLQRPQVTLHFEETNYKKKKTSPKKPFNCTALRVSPIPGAPAAMHFLWLCARQPDKVFNGQNARQSYISTEFPLKDAFKPHDSI